MSIDVFVNVDDILAGDLAGVVLQQAGHIHGHVGHFGYVGGLDADFRQVLRNTALHRQLADVVDGHVGVAFVILAHLHSQHPGDERVTGQADGTVETHHLGQQQGVGQSVRQMILAGQSVRQGMHPAGVDRTQAQAAQHGGGGQGFAGRAVATVTAGLDQILAYQLDALQGCGIDDGMGVFVHEGLHTVAEPLGGVGRLF